MNFKGVTYQSIRLRSVWHTRRCHRWHRRRVLRLALHGTNAGAFDSAQGSNGCERLVRALGYKSCVIPAFVLTSATVYSFSLCDLRGIALTSSL